VEADVTTFRGEGDADLVICQAVLEHVPNTQAALSAIASMLKPSGTATVFVPSRNAIFARLNMLLPQRLKLKLLGAIFPHMRRYQGFPAFYDRCTPRDFERLAENCGLKVVETRCYYSSAYFTFFFPLYAMWRLWTLVAARLWGPQAAETFTMVFKKAGN
jgi:2-polyprenyl-6-hydroxyphenyl methylase/3-demethylubiquinone-9 3-methyltransferase